MKSITLIYILLLLTSSAIFGQRKDSIDNKKSISVASAKENAKNKFEQDLTAKNLKIYLLGGIKSVITKEDFEFEKDFKLKYYDFGCTPPVNFEVYEKYNQLVFDYLLNEYGKSWIPAINKNAFGFLEWRKDR